MPRTKEQNLEIRDRTKKKILNTALDLFTDFGFHGTSMDRIAKKAGVSKGLAYSYFESKTKILEIVIEKCITEKIDISADLLNRVSLNTDPAKKIIQLIDEFFNLIFQHENLFIRNLRLFPQIRVSETSKEILLKYKESLKGLMIEFENIFQSAGYEDPRTEMMFFLSIMSGIFMEYYSQGKEYPFDKIKKLIIKKYSTI